MRRDYTEIIEDVKKEWERIDEQYDVTYFPHVSCGWDNNPRFKTTITKTLEGNTPEAFKEALYNAKEFMLGKIEPYNNMFYEYNNYVFYENSNFINLHYRDFPEWFTMACYNDVNYTLIFIGFDSGTLAGPSCLDKKYLENMEDNWISFLEQYYGECYDFQ